MISNTILDEIVEKKKIRLAGKKEEKAWKEIECDVAQYDRVAIDFARALQEPKYLSIIAEVKKASPSKGLIRPDFQPMNIAQAYLNSDVQAMSVLTEQDFFQGEDVFLQGIRTISSIPLLRKDFLFDEYQIYEARLLGADAVLLIAAILDDNELKSMQKTAHDLGLQTLIEVHNQEELARVLYLPDAPNMLGINNRDLKTFKEDIHTTERLLNQLNRSQDFCVVSESAMRSPEDLKYIESIGVDAALIGEGFMRQANIEEAVQNMRSYS